MPEGDGIGPVGAMGINAASFLAGAPPVAGFAIGDKKQKLAPQKGEKWSLGGDDWNDLSLMGKLGRQAMWFSPIAQAERLLRNPARPVKTRKEMLAADIERLQNDPASFGLTDAERRQMMSEASEASNVQRQAQVSDLSRSALAAPDQSRGQFVEAQTAVAEGVGADQAQAAVEANKLSQAMIQQEKARILGDVDAAADRARENARFWAEFGLDSAEAGGAIVAKAFMGGA